MTDFEEDYFLRNSSYKKFADAGEGDRLLTNYQAGFYRYLRRRFLKDLDPGRLVLEIGCGYSGLIKHFVNDGHVYTGLDVSQYIVDSMRNLYPGLEFFHGDIRTIGNLNREFDAVIALQVLEHLDDPSPALNNIFGLLKKGGIFLATVPNPRSKIPLTNWRNDSTHVSVFTQSVWRDLFHEAGFSHVESRTFSTLPFFWRFLPQLSRPFFWPEFGASIFLSARKI